MWSTCNKQTNILVSTMGSMQLFPFFLPSRWKTTCKKHGWDDWGMIFWIPASISAEAVRGGCCLPVLFTSLSCTTEKCWCMIWCFIQADTASLRHGDGGFGTPPISTVWGRYAPKYLMQRCPLDYVISLCSDASLTYVLHLGSETEMRTIPPFKWQFMYSVRTLIQIFKYPTWHYHRWCFWSV